VHWSSNESVLAPFCGCGTTIDAAKKFGRNWTGIATSPEGCWNLAGDNIPGKQSNNNRAP